MTPTQTPDPTPHRLTLRKEDLGPVVELSVLLYRYEPERWLGALEPAHEAIRIATTPGEADRLAGVVTELARKRREFARTADGGTRWELLGEVAIADTLAVALDQIAAVESQRSLEVLAAESAAAEASHG